MKRISCFVALLGAAVLYPMPAPAADSLEPVAFMAGAWGRDGEVIEYWLPPVRGLMVAVNRNPAGDEMPFFEFLRIEARTDGIVYVASPRGRGTTEFRLTEAGPGRAVFENPEHDFPTKIIYTREGDRLEAEVGGERDGEWSSFFVRLTRVPCDAAASEPNQTR